MASILPSCHNTNMCQTQERLDNTTTSNTHRRKFFRCVKLVRTFLKSIHQTSESEDFSSSQYPPVPKDLATSFPPETTHHPLPRALHDFSNLKQERNKLTRSFKRIVEVVKEKFSSSNQYVEIEPLWTNRFDLDLGPDISADKSELDYLRRTNGLGITTESYPLLEPKDEPQHELEDESHRSHIFETGSDPLLEPQQKAQ